MFILTVAVSHQQVPEEVVGDREVESDLGQLPGHHPLMKDGMSDEGVLHQWNIHYTYWLNMKVQNVKLWLENFGIFQIFEVITVLHTNSAGNFGQNFIQ